MFSIARPNYCLFVVSFSFRYLGNMKASGFAVMHMKMPMTSSTLPLKGSCTVHGKEVTIELPTTKTSFKLSEQPKVPKKPAEFGIETLMKTPTGQTFTINIRYIAELECFVGTGKEDGATSPTLTFCFFDDKSPMNKL